MKTLLEFSTYTLIPILLFSLSLHVKSNTETSIHAATDQFETTTPLVSFNDFQRVYIDRKKQLITYEYEGKQITFEIFKGDVLVKVKQLNRDLVQLKSNKKIAHLMTNKSKEWQPLQHSVKEIDNELLALLMANPTFYGKTYIGSILKNRDATDMESRMINLLSTARNQTYESTGTTTGSCSCSGQSITISCPNGCGIACRDEERDVCDVLQTESGETISDCHKETFCIGHCAC